ncbi:hypothetical protein N9L68_06800 [bacterium]|nr:hypothetical protein [bacterium]
MCPAANNHSSHPSGSHESKEAGRKGGRREVMQAGKETIRQAMTSHRARSNQASTQAGRGQGRQPGSQAGTQPITLGSNQANRRPTMQSDRQHIKQSHTRIIRISTRMVECTHNHKPKQTAKGDLQTHNHKRNHEHDHDANHNQSKSRPQSQFNHIRNPNRTSYL